MTAFIDESKGLMITADTAEERAYLEQWKDQNPKVSNIQRRLGEGVVALNITFSRGR